MKDWMDERKDNQFNTISIEGCNTVYTLGPSLLLFDSRIPLMNIFTEIIQYNTSIQLSSVAVTD